MRIQDMDPWLFINPEKSSRSDVFGFALLIKTLCWDCTYIDWLNILLHNFLEENLIANMGGRGGGLAPKQSLQSSDISVIII